MAKVKFFAEREEIMTGILKVDTSKLTSAAGELQSTGDSIRTLTTSMTDIVNALTGDVWSGEAATKYTTQFNGLKDDIDRMLNMIKEHVTDLQQMASAYEEAEAANTETAGALLSDVIS